MLADQKRKKAQYKQERDAKLKETGPDKNEDFLLEKMAEVREIADVTAQMATKRAGASEAGVQKSTSEAADDSVRIPQVSNDLHTSCTTSSIPPEDTSLLDHQRATT
jgi:hypothetical protein